MGRRVAGTGAGKTGVWVATVVALGAFGCTADEPGRTASPPTTTTAASPASPSVEVGPGRTDVLPDLGVARAAHSSTLLPDGRVLIAGGCTTPGCGGTEAGGRTELYDPGAKRFVSGPAMVQARASHTATALADGRVLIVGGWAGEGQPPLSTIEVFDPRAGRFRQVATMATGRGGHTATRLADGRVLIVGGIDGRTALTSVEIFDPATNRVLAAPSLPEPKATHAATLLDDGRVLVVGGQRAPGHGRGIVDAVLLFDPGTNAWIGAGRLPQPTYKLAVAALPGGRALILGGQTADDAASRLVSTSVFGGLAIAPGPVMSERRYKISDAAAVLEDGRVVIAGGWGVDVYADGRFTRVAGPSDVERQAPAATALPDGTVLVTGGYNEQTRPTASAVLITP